MNIFCVKKEKCRYYSNISVSHHMWASYRTIQQKNGFWIFIKRSINYSGSQRLITSFKTPSSLPLFHSNPFLSFPLKYIPQFPPIFLSLQIMELWALSLEKNCPTYFFPSQSLARLLGDPLRHLRGWCFPPPQATSNKALVISCSWLCHHFDFF